MDMEKWIYLVIGFVLVFVGSAYHNVISRRRNGVALTDFQSFLFGTGVVYFAMVLWNQITFFIDYYNPGYVLQNPTFDEATFMDRFKWFFNIFGLGAGNTEQYPVYNMNLNFIACVVGGALGGAALVIYRKFRNKKDGTPENGLLYGYKFPKTTLKEFVKNEFHTFRKQVFIVEYLCWWVLRGLMVYQIIRWSKDPGDGIVLMQLKVNIVATFIIPIARFLFFNKLFFGKINYRVQTFIDMFICFGSLMGQGFGLHHKIDEYDKILHVVSGGVVVFVGWLLIEGTRNGKKISKFSTTAASMGFSCVVMIMWEIFEFFTDFYFPDSTNQNYRYHISDKLFFYRVFGPLQNENLKPVFDTDIDLFTAVLGCVVCGLILLIALTVSEKIKKSKAEKEAAAAAPEAAEAPETVSVS